MTPNFARHLVNVRRHDARFDNFLNVFRFRARRRAPTFNGQIVTRHTFGCLAVVAGTNLHYSQNVL